MKVYITKYALTRGIYEIDAEICESGDGDMIKDKKHGFLAVYYHGKNKDWHTDRRNAKVAAEYMRNKKIKSLKAEIEKLNKLKF